MKKPKKKYIRIDRLKEKCWCGKDFKLSEDPKYVECTRDSHRSLQPRYHKIQAFECVNGPCIGEEFTWDEKPEGYFLYNAAYGGRSILVWEK